MQVVISRSTRRGKKYMAAIEGGTTVHFGAAGYDDFTTHGDEQRKASYLARNKAENWTLQGVRSAGFWARWVLWNKASVAASIRDINARFSSLSVR